MAKDSLSLKWVEDMEFESNINGHKITIDANPDFGGHDKGPRPKPLMMLALAGCTGLDVISILHKMRVFPDSFEVKIESEVTEEHPKHYSSMKVIYEFTGQNLPEGKLKRAVELSEQQYCGVSAVYKKAIHLQFEIKLNNEIIA